MAHLQLTLMGTIDLSDWLWALRVRISPQETPWYFSQQFLCTLLPVFGAWCAFYWTLRFNRKKHREDLDATERRHVATLRDSRDKHQLDMAAAEQRHTSTLAESREKHRADSIAAETRHREGRELALRKDTFFKLFEATTDLLFAILWLSQQRFNLEKAIDASRLMGIQITNFQATANRASICAAFSLQKLLMNALKALAPIRKRLDYLWPLISEDKEKIAHMQLTKRPSTLQDLNAFEKDFKESRDRLSSNRTAAAELLTTFRDNQVEWMNNINPTHVAFLRLAREELGMPLGEGDWFEKLRADIMEEALSELRKIVYVPENL